MRVPARRDRIISLDSRDDCLDRLAGLPRDPDAWRRRFAAYSAAFEPAVGPQEGPPAEYQGGH